MRDSTGGELPAAFLNEQKEPCNKVVVNNQAARYSVPVVLIGLGIVSLIKQSRDIQRKRVEKDEIEYSTAYKVFPENEGKEVSWRESSRNMGILCGWKEKDVSRVQLWKEETDRKAEKVKSSIRGEVQETRDSMILQFHQHVWIMTACMVALGVAVAAGLPRTRKEDQWMGGWRDFMMESAKVKFQAMVEKAKQEMIQTTEKVIKESLTCAADPAGKSRKEENVC